MPTLNKSSPILIIGGGSWGCATALELARRGYTNIKVLEASSIPSPIAAGNDINKIMEEAEPSDEDTDKDYVWSRMHQLASRSWLHDPVYAPYYHRTGFIMSCCSDSVYKRIAEDAKRDMHEWTPLESPEDFRSTMPEGVLTGPFPSWRGFWKRAGAGWVFARAAILSAYEESKRLGVTFVEGTPRAKVTTLLFNSARTSVLGAQTADGVQHRVECTILTAGANSDLLFDFESQLRPTAWTLSHLPLTEEEAELYKDLPVLFNAERGFFIEPDAQKREMKICDEHPGYLNWVSDPTRPNGAKRSVPFARHQIPAEAERRARRFLRETMPHLAEREFSFARICWDADTVDRVFLIDRHPTYEGLVVGVGGSGNGFMNMPSAGKVLADTVEGRAEERLRRCLRWRPEIAVKRDWWDTQGRFGGDNKVMDLQDVTEWTRIGEGTKGSGLS